METKSLIGKRDHSNDSNQELAPPLAKRQKVEESFELKNLPSANSYEKSFMHKDQVTHIQLSTKFDFIFTCSVDGYVKFWRKVVQGIEFVKAYRAHLHPISSVSLSPNEERFATCCPVELSIKVFDVVNFDLINMIKLNFSPFLI